MEEVSESSVGDWVSFGYWVLVDNEGFEIWGDRWVDGGGDVPESVSQSSSSGTGPSCERVNSSSTTSSSLTILAGPFVEMRLVGWWEVGGRWCGG